MNLLERVLTLLRANLDTIAERADDPEKALQQLHLDMRNQLVQVKTEVAKAIAEGHVLQKRVLAKKTEADIWLKKAEVAVQQDNDPSARQALTRYNENNKIVQRYQAQKKEQEQLVLTMRGALHKLEDKIAEVEANIELLATRKRNALIQQRVFEALSKVGNTDQEKMARTKDALLMAEARAQALADLNTRDVDTQLDTLSSEQALEQQLNQLKNQHAQGQSFSQTVPLPTQNKPHRQQPRTGPLAQTSAEESSVKRRARLQSRHAAHNSSADEEVSTEKDLDVTYMKKWLDASQPTDI